MAMTAVMPGYTERLTASGPPANWWIGATVKGQGPRSSDDIAALTEIRGNLWLSLEPICDYVDLSILCVGRVGLVVIGCDNQASQPFDHDWVRHAVLQSAGVPGTNIYVKQLWLHLCPDCGDISANPGDCYHGRRENFPTRRLRRLCTDPADFPEGLRMRQLPWTLTMGAKP